MSKITKKSLAILIIAVLLSSLMPNLISNAAEPSVTITDSATGKTNIEANVGDNFTVDLALLNGLENATDFQFTLEYNPEQLQVIDFSLVKDILKDENGISRGSTADTSAESEDQKTAYITGCYIIDTEKGNYLLKTSGKLGTIEFKILKGGDITLKFYRTTFGFSDGEQDVFPTDTFTVKVPIPMTGLNTEKVEKDLYVGETVQMNVSKLPVDTTDTTAITYVSSNPSVATVDSSGLVKAVSNGTATITAECGTYSVECGKVTVKTPLTSVSLNKTSETLHKGAELTLVPTTNANVSDTVNYSWESSKHSVATVDENGKVNAIGVGNATITVTASSDTITKQATCEITVDSPLTGLKLTSAENVYLEIGATETANMVVEVLPADTTDNKTITYTSSNQAVATVNESGVITAVNEGKTTVTAKCGNFSVSCNVTVTVHINSVEISSEEFTLYVAQDPVNLTVTYNPEIFTDQGAVEWSVSGDSVKVENGKVTALKPGTAKVKATLKSNSSIYDEVTVTVPEVRATGVVINTSKVTIEKYAENRTKLNVKLVEPEDHPTTDKLEDLNIVWTSNNKAIVKVEKGENGEATLVPVSSGTTNVSVKVGDYDEVSCKVTVVCSLESIKVQTVGGASTNLVMENETTPATVQLEVVKTPTDADARVEDVVFTLKNDSVATVSNTGVVTAVKPGNAVIVATLDGKEATIQVSVDAMLADVEIENENENLVIYKGKTSTLQVNLMPSYATIVPTAEWSSSNEDIATVSNTGIVTAKKEGTATITVKYTHENGTEVTTSRNVVVKEVKATGVTITQKPESILKNEQSTLEIQVSKDSETEELTDEIYWTSTDSGVAYVVYSDGVYKVVGVKEGTATITVKVGDYSENFEVEVKEVHIESLKAGIEGTTITEGNQAKVNVTVNPENSTDDKNFTYTVDNESVAKVVVDENGTAYVKAINAGKAIVTVTAENGVKTTFEVSVAAKPATSGGNSGGGSSSGGDTVGAVAQVAESLVGSPHTGDMNVLALVIMTIVSLAGMVITIKKK